MKLNRYAKTNRVNADEWHRYFEARRKLEQEWRNYLYLRDHGRIVHEPRGTPPITPDGTPPGSPRPEETPSLLNLNVSEIQRVIGGMKTRIGNLEYALSENALDQ
jgi:hypothetical protein